MFNILIPPDWKKERDQTYSCPRDSRYHGGVIENLLKPPGHHSIILSMGLRKVLNLYPIMPRDDSLSDKQCKFLQAGFILATIHQARQEKREKKSSISIQNSINNYDSLKEKN